MRNFKAQSSSGQNNRGTINVKGDRPQRARSHAQAYWKVAPKKVNPVIEERYNAHKSSTSNPENRMAFAIKVCKELYEDETDEDIRGQVEFYRVNGHLPGESAPNKDPQTPEEFQK
jgi:hypothetical protein